MCSQAGQFHVQNSIGRVSPTFFSHTKKMQFFTQTPWRWHVFYARKKKWLTHKICLISTTPRTRGDHLIVVTVRRPKIHWKESSRRMTEQKIMKIWSNVTQLWMTSSATTTHISSDCCRKVHESLHGSSMSQFTSIQTPNLFSIEMLLHFTIVSRHTSSNRCACVRVLCVDIYSKDWYRHHSKSHVSPLSWVQHK